MYTFFNFEVFFFLNNRIKLFRAMNSGDLHKVWQIKALKKPGEDEAKKILDRIAKQVQPIMRKHKWRVKLLSEFWYLFFIMIKFTFLMS